MRESPHQRVYRRLLRLYPGWFRRLYATQGETDFAEMIASCRGSPGRFGRTALAWVIAVQDLARSLPSE